MDPMKKTDLEQRIVVGLLFVFGTTFVMGPMRQLGWFRAGAPKQQTLSSEQMSLSKPLEQTFQNHWKQLEAQVEAGVSGASGSRRAPAETYTAQGLRDPLKSLLPEVAFQPPADSETTNEPKASAPTPQLPSLSIQGLWWGPPTPRAIVNGKVYGIGDRVEGATITAIERDGLTVDYAGTMVKVRALAPDESKSGTLARTPRGR